MEDTSYRIVFPGKPIPLNRPRLGRRGIYDSQISLKKKTIHCLMQQKHLWQKIEGPVRMHFEFRMPIPKCSKKKAEQMIRSHHTRRPDLSNMVKYYEDCLQGQVYDDDSQIVEITAVKINSYIGETIIHIWRQNENI